MSEMDNTHKKGSRPIDSVATMPKIISCIEGCKLIEVNQIMINDYRDYLIDLNFKLYFSEQMSLQDTINRRVLNLLCRSHREKFYESLETLIDEIGIMESI